jgi:DNA repair protein SbcC/Rad50
MIPNRISLKGFLSYREAVEFDFQGEPLWMLSGPNGSGKSAVFDAMTYALFGTHRLGSQNADALIHKEADALEVVFEFEHAGHDYRIRRALRRAKNPRPSQQAFRRDGAEAWQAIEETEGVKELKQWVEHGLGLRYETFTTSVLLLQGKAENLISADPRDRRAVLHGVVDMQRYVRLHDLIDERRKGHRAARDAQEKLLRGQPEIADADVAAADQDLERFVAERVRCATDLQRWQRLEMQAERWPGLQRQAEELQTRLAQAEQILGDAAAIETGWQRHEVLRDLLPRLEAALQARTRWQEQRGALEALSGREQELAAQQAHQEQERAAARGEVETYQRDSEGERARLPALDVALAQQTMTLQRLEQLARRREEWDALQRQLAEFPADLAEQLAESEHLLAESNELRVALPWLTALHEDRLGAREAAAQVAALSGAEPSLRAALERAEADLQRADAALAAAEQAVLTSQDELVRVRTRCEQAEERARKLAALDGKPSCSFCGQPLTAAHMQVERDRLAEEATALRAQHDHAESASQAAQRGRAEQQALRKACQAAAERSRQELAERQSARLSAVETQQRRQQACERAYAQLPEPFRQRAAGQDTPGDYPSAAELEKLRQRNRASARLSEANVCLRQQREEQQLLLQKHIALRDALGDEASGAEEKTRAEVERLRQERQQAEAAVAQLEKALVLARQRLDELEKSCAEGAGQRAALRGAAQEAARQVEELAGVFRQRRDDLPLPWQASFETTGAEVIAALRDEFATLAQIGARYQSLQLARRQRADWQEQADRLASDIVAIPTEARQPLAQVRGARQDIEAALGVCEQQHRAAEHHLHRLHEQRQRRAATLAELQRADHQYHLAERLAQLLGPRGLQLHLMREAERSIAELANEALERLSGGELTLELACTEEGDPAENPLQLQVRCRTVGAHPLQVAQLSGSQKFRVAVSLALAIGQYASRAPQTLDAVIIDEGFGCLDRAGRQVMIQELHQLKDQLRRIILVSHQEEFAETFSAGYELQLKEGSTRATRVHQ